MPYIGDLSSYTVVATAGDLDADDTFFLSLDGTLRQVTKAVLDTVYQPYDATLVALAALGDPDAATGTGTLVNPFVYWDNAAGTLAYGEFSSSQFVFAAGQINLSPIQPNDLEFTGLVTLGFDSLRIRAADDTLATISVVMSDGGAATIALVGPTPTLSLIGANIFLGGQFSGNNTGDQDLSGYQPISANLTRLSAMTDPGVGTGTAIDACSIVAWDNANGQLAYFDLSSQFVVSSQGVITFVGTPTPAGSDTQVQFNDAGILAGDSGFTWNKTSNQATITGAILVGSGTLSVGTSGVGVIVIGNSTVPTTQPAGLVQVFAADYTTGDSRLRVLSETGGGVWLGNQTYEAVAPASGAGNSITIKASAAASGNTNGGDVNLAVGAGAGSGVAGRVVSTGAVLVPDGTLSLPGMAFANNPNVGFYQQVAGTVVLGIGGNSVLQISNAGKVALAFNYALGWSSSTPTAANPDTTIHRAASKVVKLADGSSGTNGATLSSPWISPTQLTANQDNYNPGVARNYRLSSDASRDITGLSISQVDGQEFYFYNIGSNNIVLKHDVTSTAANRFYCTGGADITLAAYDCARIVYDNTTQRFRATKF